MRNLLNFYIFSNFAFAICNSCLTDNDKELLSSFTRSLGISYYILVAKSCAQVSLTSLAVKYFSKTSVYFLCLDFSSFLLFFSSETFSHDRTAFILKITDESDKSYFTKEIKNTISQTEEFALFKWIMILPKNSSALNETNFSVPYDCQFITAVESGKGYDLSEIYQIREKSKMIHTKIGHWDGSVSFQFPDKYFYFRRMNMGKEKMILEKYRRQRCRSVAQCLQTEVWLIIEQALNFSTIDINRNEASRKEVFELADVSVQISPYHIINEQSFYMIAPTVIVRCHLYIKFITDENVSWALYFKPFNQDLWTAVIFWTLLSGAVIAMIAKTASTVLSMQGFTMLEHGLTPLTAFAYQSCIFRPRLVSSRIARINTFVVSSVIVPAYSAALISCLAVHRPKIPFTDFETFVEDGTYKMGAMSHPFMIAFFELSDHPTISAIRDKQLIPYNDFPKSRKSVCQMLCSQEKMAVLAYNYQVLDFPTPCPIIRASNTILNVYVGLQLQYGSPYRTIFNKLLTKIRENGVLEKLQNGLYGPKTMLTEKKFTVIDFKMTQSVHNFSMFGIISSILFLTLEIIFNRIKRSPNAKTETKTKRNVRWLNVSQEF